MAINDIDKSYEEEVFSYPLLSQEEQKELGRRAKEGDKEALDKLVNSNLRYVMNIAKRYANRGVPLMDLINEGNMGLIDAAKHYDPEKGNFLTYAQHWVIQRILKALFEQSTLIRIPLSQRKNFKEISRAISELVTKLERIPTIREVAQYTGIDVKKASLLYNYYKDTLSLDMPIDEEITLIDRLPDKTEDDPEETAMKKVIMSKIYSAIDELDDREKKILCLYYGLKGHPRASLREIAKIMNISRERVRQIKDRALEKIRQMTGADE